MGSSARLEDIPELIQRIQLRLPVKEAARTSILSKSWLHAWSTHHILRFRQAQNCLSEEQKRAHLDAVDRTLIRYLSNNIPVQKIYLKIDKQNKGSAVKWIQRLATAKSYRNKLSLSIYITKTSLPHQILSIENLTKITVTVLGKLSCYSRLMTSHPVINCVSLQKLQLTRVHIQEEVLHSILSTCTLLEVLELSDCKGFDTIKFRNLHYLRRLIIDSIKEFVHRLSISSDGQNHVLEINDLPSLSYFRSRGNPLFFNTVSLGRVTHLSIGEVIMDHAFLDMIKLKFPLLETLILYMGLCKLESFHFTSSSMKRLALLWCPHTLLDVQVVAPKLHCFSFRGKTMPSLVFPAAANTNLLEEIEVIMTLSHLVDASFFLKLSQVLALSIKCKIVITMKHTVTFDIDILSLRESVPFPAMNVQELSFQTIKDEGQWEHSPFFDALFSICHPKQVVAKPDENFQHNNHFHKLMVSKAIQKENTRKDGEYLNWAYYLKGFEITTEDGEPLPDSLRCSLDGSDRVIVFKLKWH